MYEFCTLKIECKLQLSSCFVGVCMCSSYYGSYIMCASGGMPQSKKRKKNPNSCFLNKRSGPKSFTGLVLFAARW